MLTGSASLRSATGPASPPFRPLVQVGNGQLPRPASLPACQSLIRRLMVGRYAPAAVCSGSFLPQNSVGGRNGRFALSGGGFAAFADFPPPPPVGVRGVKGKKGIAGFRDRSRLVAIDEAGGHPPALRRRFAAGGSILSAAIRHHITPEVIVDEFFHQFRAVHTHHRGVNIEPLRRFNGKMDGGFDLWNGLLRSRFYGKPLTRLAVTGIRWIQSFCRPPVLPL